jgi:exopolysaccharide biosynthesis polyprenyl glycosylphosphotransferase
MAIQPSSNSVVAAGRGLALTPQSRPRAWQRRYILRLRLTDSIVVASVVALAQMLRFGALTGGSLDTGVNLVDYPLVSVLIAAVWLGALGVYRSRAPQVIGGGLEEYRRVWSATLSLFGVIAVVSMLFHLEIARGYLAIALPLGLVALTANRWMCRKLVVRRRHSGSCMNSVLAVGRPDSVRALAQALARSPGDGYRLVGVCAPGMPRDRLSIPSVGEVPNYWHDGDIVSAVVEAGADTVALTSGHLDPDEIRDLSWQLEKIDVDLVVSPGMADVAGPRLMVRHVGGQPLLHVDKPQYDGAKRFQKRAFDVCLSSLVLLAASPVLVAAAIAVKLTSPGPVFYLAERIGLDGKPFQMIKFRSMVVDADKRRADVAHLNEGGGVLFKIRCDPRVTPVGRFLRRYSIDELPQFINVLRRDMSVVGPRPPLRNEVDAYDDKVRRRLLVRPGITGLWQVSGRSDLSWEDSVRLDISYVENWSMINDLVIAMKTVSVVTRGAGAY